MEAELQEVRGRCQHYHDAVSLIEELIGRISVDGSEEGGSLVNSDLLKQLKHHLEQIKSTEGESTLALCSSGQFVFGFSCLLCEFWNNSTLMHFFSLHSMHVQ